MAMPKPNASQPFSTGRLDRFFRLTESGTNVRTEVLAGFTTFLTMAYIIVVQPSVLSGEMFNISTGMNFKAIMTATCLSAAGATLLMGLLARYPIALAPGMGANFFFVLTVIPGTIAAGYVENSWQVALGVIFIAGLLFIFITISGMRDYLMNAISPNLKHGIAVGIGLFIAFIGFQNAGLVQADPGTGVTLNTNFASPDIFIFFCGLVVTAGLVARRVTGAILWGMVITTLLAIILYHLVPFLPESYQELKSLRESQLMTRFQLSESVFSLPPDVSPTFFKMDLKGALSWSMLPYIIMFLFIDVFDTMGTLVAVGHAGGFMKNNRLPRANRAFLADALGTSFGAIMGSSTVTAYIESAAGIKQGGRTGLTAIVISICFLLALFLAPVIQMIGSYAPITAPALVIVGGMMLGSVTHLDLDDFSEFLPAFVVILGIPLSYSIADGIALGFITYPLTKLISGRSRESHWLMYALAILMIVYFIFLRTPLSES